MRNKVLHLSLSQPRNRDTALGSEYITSPPLSYWPQYEKYEVPCFPAAADWPQSVNSNVLALLSAHCVVDLPIDALEAPTPRLQGRRTCMNEALNSTMSTSPSLFLLSGVDVILRTPDLT